MSVDVEILGDNLIVEPSDNSGIDVDVLQDFSVEVVLPADAAPDITEVYVAGLQGPPGNDNFFISPDAPVLPDDRAYVWIETASDGFSIWVEDGT